MTRTILFTAFVFVTLLFGCSTDEPTPSSPQAAIIDPALVGDWVAFDTHSRPGDPPLSISGLRIHPDGRTQRLGVELATGKLAVCPTGDASTKFLHLANGFWVIDEFTPPGSTTTSGNYTLRRDTLLLSVSDHFANGTGFNTTYIRIPVGTTISEPIDVQFSAKVNGKLFQVSDIYAHASAFARYDFNKDTSRLTIYGNFEIYDNNVTESIAIWIGDVTTIGTFVLGSSSSSRNARYGYFEGDMFDYWSSESGKVTVTKIDFAKERCEGTFEFVAKAMSRWKDVVVTDGRFSIPLYK